jgi:GT2 family glycosyltransferase
LPGGNAVIRRAVLERCGPYATDILRTHARLLSGEDADMYERLLAVGAQGFYTPDLIVFHHIFPERLTKRYFRRWAFWNRPTTWTT